MGHAAEALGRAIAAWISRLDGILRPEARRHVVTYGLLVTFVAITASRAVGAWQSGTWAIDVRIYRAAAEAALAGGNPWEAGAGGFTFAAPPPTLLAYLPAAVVPEGVAIAIYAVISIVAAAAALRTLGLPVWWLLFPPISDSLFALNPDVLIIGLLVATPRAGALAMVLKIYAAVPLALQGRWGAVAAGSVLCVLSVPWWSMFVNDFDDISRALTVQSFGGLSAWGSWVAIPTVIALLILRGRGASWLVVPALWPYTQLHYACLAIPAARRSPTLAFLLSFAVPLFPAFAVIVEAVRVVMIRWLEPYRQPVTRDA